MHIISMRGEAVVSRPTRQRTKPNLQKHVKLSVAVGHGGNSDKLNFATAFTKGLARAALIGPPRSLIMQDGCELEPYSQPSPVLFQRTRETALPSDRMPS